MLFAEKDAPRYGPGFTAVVVTSIASVLLSFVYRFLCVYSNKKRDREGTEENFDNAYEDDFTDRTVQLPRVFSLRVMIATNRSVCRIATLGTLCDFGVGRPDVAGSEGHRYLSSGVNVEFH